MNPASFMSSLTGVVSVIMVFSIPILAIVAAMVLILVGIKNHSRERMKMIEQGMMPPPPKKQTGGNYYGLLICGAILLAFGLALFVAELVSHGNDFEGGLIFGLIGLALLACFILIRSVRKKEKALSERQYPEDPPPSTT